MRWFTNRKNKNKFPVKQRVVVEDGNIDHTPLMPAFPDSPVTPNSPANPVMGSVSFRKRARRQQLLTKEEELNIPELCTLSDQIVQEEYGTTNVDAVIDKMTAAEFADHMMKIRKRRKQLQEIQANEPAYIS